MKRLIIAWFLAAWCLTLGNARADNPILPLKKPEAASTVQIPVSDLNERAAALAKQLLDKPTVQARGPSEIFSCTPEQYFWLLDNPDRAVTAWRRLGAKCVSIQRKAPGKFGYVDELGSEVTWETIHQAAGMRIWYAEGKVKASPVLPLVPVKAMVILHHASGKLADGNVVVQHHSEVVMHTDSKVAAGVTKLMGQSAPKLAEQGLAQLQLFFSALSCYLDRHPDHVETLMRPEAANPMRR